jgi:thymidylate synthase
MYISADTLDDLLREVFIKIRNFGKRVEPTQGPNQELFGVLLELTQPVARLSRTESKGTVFSCLGETLWYLAGSNKLDFITHYLPDYGKYSDDGVTTWGAYGPRIFSTRGQVDQLENVVRLLRTKSPTRQAVIQLFHAEDIVEAHKDVPCTCTLQFLLRENSLHLIVTMRSNDAYLGLPHDIFAFTFLQELVARQLDMNLGAYKHFVGSLHLYDRDRLKAEAFINEGWQSTIAMPHMPVGNPWPSIAAILKAESRIRSGLDVVIKQLKLSNYWADLVRLLQIYANTEKKERISTIRNEMSSEVFDIYIEKRASMTPSGAEAG